MPKEQTLEEESAAQSLQCFIGELSQRHFHADWHTGCEYVLWECVVDPESGLRINVEDRAELAILALRAGGWWRWDDDDDDVRFIPVEDWRTIYADWKRGINHARLRPGAHHVLKKLEQMRDDSESSDAHLALERAVNWIENTFGRPKEKS